MAYVVQCDACKTQMTLSESLFERRIAGRQVTLRCKQCNHPIAVDGAALREGAENLSPPPEGVNPVPAVTSVTPSATLCPALGRPNRYPTLMGFPSSPPPMTEVPEPHNGPQPAAAAISTGNDRGRAEGQEAGSPKRSLSALRAVREPPRASLASPPARSERDNPKATRAKPNAPPARPPRLARGRSGGGDRSLDHDVESAISTPQIDRADSIVSLSAGPSPLPRRVKTTIGLPLLGPQKPAAAAASDVPLAGASPPIMPPPALLPPQRGASAVLLAPPTAAANEAERLTAFPDPTTADAVPNVSAPQAEEADTALPDRTVPRGFDHRELLDCPAPPAPPTPPPPAPSAPRQAPPVAARRDDAPQTGAYSAVPWTDSDRCVQSHDAAALAEATTTDFAIGSSDAPTAPRRSHRIPLVGLAAAALLGAGLAVTIFLTDTADHATLVAAAHTLEQASRSTPPSSSARAAKPAPSTTTETQPGSAPNPEPAPGLKRSVEVIPGPALATAASLSTPEPATQLPGAESIPEGVHAPTVLHRIYLAMQRAENCHKGGRAVGTTTVWFTFAPNGSVSEVRLDGEPIASAPVGGCVRYEASLVRIPKFQGDPFTVKHKLRLR